MIFSFCRQRSHSFLRVNPAFAPLIFGLSCFAANAASAQQLPSNVYRPPRDNFNQSIQQTIAPQGQTIQSGPQSQALPGSQRYFYPQQNPTPIYQPPLQQAPVQVIPRPVQVVPNPVPTQSDSEKVNLKRALVKARDLMQKYQVKMEEVSKRNKELSSEIANLRQAGEVKHSDQSSDSQELAAAKAAVSEAQQQVSALNDRLKNAQRDLKTTAQDLDRQKQTGAKLQQQIVELQSTVKMAAGGDQQVGEMTKNLQQFKLQNGQLNAKVADLQNALREKETQIGSMVSDDETKLVDLKELLQKSETTNEELEAANKELSMKLKAAMAEAAEMTAPQSDPTLDQLRADYQQLGQQNQQLESENSQLNETLGKLRTENSELDATVTRLSNIEPPVDTPEVAPAIPVAAPSPDLTNLQNQIASLTRRNGQLERQLRHSKSKYTTLSNENSRLVKEADSDATASVAAAPVDIASTVSDVAPVSLSAPELGLDSVSAGWPVKYWIFGMLGVGLAVGLAVAWYESVVDPKGRRHQANTMPN